MEKDLAASILRDVAQIRQLAEELESQLEALVPVPEFPDPTPDEHLDNGELDWDSFGESEFEVLEQAVPAVVSFREERDALLQKTVDDALERLAGQLALGHTDEFRRVIRFWSSFWKYSPGNALLIMAQKPDAEAVASYSTWKKLNRQVRKGARAAFIWCPVLKQVENEATGLLEERLMGFRPGGVFSDKDLIGDEPLPSLFKPLPDTHAELYTKVVARLHAQGITVVELPLRPGVQGFSNGTEIVIRHGLDSQNRLAVCAHELTHHLWHHADEAKPLPLAQKEFEAEVCAAIVCDVLKVNYQAAGDYILSWGGSVKQLQTSLPRVHLLVKRVLAVMLPKE